MRDGVTRSDFGSLFAGIAWPLTSQFLVPGPWSLVPWPEWGLGVLGYHGPSGRFVWGLICPRLRLGLRDVGPLGLGSAFRWHCLAPDPSVPEPMAGMGWWG